MIKMASPIENTKTLRSGKAMAWIIAPREIPLAALTSGATTTTELDQFIDDTQEATS